MRTTESQPSNIKAEASQLLHDLPDDASWEDLMHQIYVRQKIETGLADLNAGRIHSHESIKNEFGFGL